MGKELAGQSHPEGARGSVLMDISDRGVPEEPALGPGYLLNILINDINERMRDPQHICRGHRAEVQGHC